MQGGNLNTLELGLLTTASLRKDPQLVFHDWFLWRGALLKIVSCTAYLITKRDKRDKILLLLLIIATYFAYY